MLGGLERRSALLRPPHSNNSNSTTSQIFKFRNSSLLKDWIKLEDFTVWETERKKNREMQKQNCITGPGSILLSILLAIVGIGKPEMYLFEKFSCFRFFVKVLYFELYIFVRRMTCGNFCGFSRCAFTLFDQVHFKVDKMNLILLNPVVDSVSFSVNSFFDISSFEMKQSLCQKILVSLFIKNSSKTLDEIL